MLCAGTARSRLCLTALTGTIASLSTMAGMTAAEEIAEIMNRRLPEIRPGTLCFWGEWFGRPFDNLHRLIGCGAEGDLLRIRFDQNEILSVWSPLNCQVHAAGSRGQSIFRLEDAARVRWEWVF